MSGGLSLKIAIKAAHPPSPGTEHGLGTQLTTPDDGGVCYGEDGVKVTHWRRSHVTDGASAYRLDWNGLSFVWTGDGKPDQLAAKYAKGADVFVTGMAVDFGFDRSAEHSV